MLARYRIVRGARPPDDPLPDGVRQDTRKHTRHPARPSAELVMRLLNDPSPAAFAEFRRGYHSLLEARWLAQRAHFDEIAALARTADVYFGCNCPTLQQPDVHHCHTVLALEFFAARYPDLDVRMP